MFQLLILAAIGAAAGAAAPRVMPIRMTPTRAMALGAAGAVVGGLVARAALPFLFALAGGVAGALLLIWLVQRFRD